MDLGAKMDLGTRLAKYDSLREQLAELETKKEQLLGEKSEAVREIFEFHGKKIKRKTGEVLVCVNRAGNWFFRGENPAVGAAPEARDE